MKKWIRPIAYLLSILEMWLLGVGYGMKTDLPVQPQPSVQTVRSIEGDNELSASVIYAEQMANTVQAAYTDARRRAYRVENTQMCLTHTLHGFYKHAALTDKTGGVWLEDAFGAFCADKFGEHGVNMAAGDARVNTIRLGLYYYECHVRDLSFTGTKFVLDKVFHVYGDRLYTQYTLYAKEATTDLSAFGSRTRIPARSVAALQIRDANGVHTDPADADETSVLYAAFDVKDVGVVAFILPENGGRLTIKKEAGNLA